MTRPDPAAVPDVPAAPSGCRRDPRHGLPVPPVHLHPGPDGIRPARSSITINAITSAELAAARRCALCGDAMGDWVAFLGTPRAAEALRYTDPPGHSECLTAALMLCPEVASAGHRRTRTDRCGGPDGVMPTGTQSGEPDGWTLGLTRSYRSVFVPADGCTVYYPAPFGAMRVYVYGPDGRLQHRTGTA